MKTEKRIKFGNTLLFAVLFATLALSVTVGCASGATPPEEEWNQTFGGTGGDWAESVQQTADGGYILAGWTRSYGASWENFWLVKTDSNGNEQWNKTFGGTGYDKAYSVQQTSDGGYILAGSTWSYGAGYCDFWLVKTDSNGNKEWDRTFGGTSWDNAYAVQQTADGGYILVGVTESYGAGQSDGWLVKTDSNGNKQWDKTFGGTSADSASSVQQTSDGGYVLAGCTHSYGAGDYDFWLVKTDSGGNEEWSKTFGGADTDVAYTVQQTSDGGYILAGFTESYGAGESDFWLVKTDSNGNKEWDNTFGGTSDDWAESAQQTADGGYILAGFTESYGAGYYDFWLVKTDANGNKEWDKTFGGTDYDWAHAVQQTSDGGYILAGYTMSYSAGSTDFWLVKVKGEEPTEPTISIYTDKTSYTAGDTMNLGLDVNNPLDSAQRVNIGIWLDMPAYPWTYTLINKPFTTLSPELDYSNPSFKVFTLGDIPAGTYTWHAIICDPFTETTLSEDTAEWVFGSRGASTETEEIREVLEQITIVIDFGE